LTDGFRLGGERSQGEPQPKKAGMLHRGLRWTMIVWLAVMFVLPLAETVSEILSPDFNAPDAMASYLNQHVPQDALIETWEPEMGFLTDHNYHFPPALLLLDAVKQVNLNGPPVAQLYHFAPTELPRYVLLGDFGRWVELYPNDFLAARYTLVTQIGGYELYEFEE
jgi:hypothetical protein